jgi:hypothetical protein
LRFVLQRRIVMEHLETVQVTIYIYIRKHFQSCKGYCGVYIDIKHEIFYTIFTSLAIHIDIPCKNLVHTATKKLLRPQ